MLKFLKKSANTTYTENSEVTKRSTESYCLDLFATIGALRNNTERDIEGRFLRAFAENPLLALKIVFFARDIRCGLGERRVFRNILNYVARNNPEIIAKNISLIPEFGRFDDLLALFDTPCENQALEVISEQLVRDQDALARGENVSLMAKWLPSVNTSNAQARADGKKIARFLGITDKEYRKILVKLRAQIKIIENNLREKDYTFDYSKQPSKAMFKYRAAFYRNDQERYEQFLEDVQKGKEKLNTGTLTPFDLVRTVIGNNAISPAERKSLNTTWDKLASTNNNTNTLAVIDTSGSMTWPKNIPITAAISLGLYFAEHNKGAFANHFIMFSRTPQLIEIKGKDFVEKVKYIKSFCEVANTNVEAVYDLILKTAVENKLKQHDLPERLIFISDMEFDGCVKNASQSNFENAKQNFARFGYSLPKIVFWNVNSRNMHLPVSKNEQGVTLVSGFSSNIFDMVIEGNLNPYEFMLKTLDTPRYNQITI